MRYLLAILLCLVVPSCIEAEGISYSLSDNEYRCIGTVRIAGSSNLGPFSFKLQMADSLVRSNRYERQNIVFPGFTLLLPVKDFKGRTAQMNKDFNELLQSGQYPEIRIVLKSVDLECSDIEQQIIKTEILIAGIVQHYNINCKIEPLDEMNFQIECSRRISIKDFHLKPPERLMGLIKIDELIYIHFKLTLQNIKNTDFEI